MKFTDLPVITSSSMTNSHVFAVATSSSTDQISLSELQKCFTGFTAPSSSSINIVGGTTASGLTVGANGYVGVNNTNPVVALDIGDQGSATIAETRLASRGASRQASYTLTDNTVWWRATKKANDTDYYLETSSNGSSFTTVFNIDSNGNVGIHDGSSALSDKFYVNGGTVKFQSGVSGIVFDPGVCEIKNSVAGDILYINKSTDDDVVLGNNVLYIENGTNSYVGINTTAPEHALDIKDSGHFVRFNNTVSNTTNLSLSNTSNTAYVSLIGNNFQIGTAKTNSSLNLIYDISNKRLGVGTTSVESPLHIKTTDSNSSIFETSSQDSNDIIVLNSYATGPVLSNVVTFATGSASSPTKRWSVGLYNYGSLNNIFAFSLDGSTSTAGIKAYLDRNGNFDIDGNYSSSTSYCKGKFIQNYQTRVTGDCIYFSPFSPNSNTNPSGHNDAFAPFGITPYSGSIEQVQILTSDVDCSLLLTPLRFEVVAITPTYNASTPNGFVSGFFISPTSNPNSYPTSGIIGYASIASVSPNQLITFTRDQFNGDTSFSSGRLLQYRIVEEFGTKSVNVDFTVMSTISYIIT